MNDAQREFLERVANSDHLIALGKVGSGSVAAALSDLSAKDRRIAELEAEIAGHPGALAAAKREALEGAEKAIRPGICISTKYLLALSHGAAAWQALEDAADKIGRMAREVKP